jgi:hypothetical protein
MEGTNLFICKQNEDLRVDMRKLVEASYEKDGSISMMEKTIHDKNMEMSKLELEKDDNKQMMASIILMKNKALATNKTIIHEKDLIMQRLKEGKRKPESEKRLNEIILA